MTYYGSRLRPNGDLVPDWLMGGNRKRRVLASLADPGERDGWAAEQLVADLGCARSTVYETIRALRALDVITPASGGLLRLDLDTSLGAAIANLVTALRPLEAHVVDRPPRPRTSAVGEGATESQQHPASRAPAPEDRSGSGSSGVTDLAAWRADATAVASGYLVSTLLWGHWLRSLGERHQPCGLRSAGHAVRQIPPCVR